MLSNPLGRWISIPPPALRCLHLPFRRWTSLVVKQRSRLLLDQEFDLTKIRLQNEDEASKRQTDAKRDYELARMASEREIEFKRIDTNLITSHARVASE